MEWNVHGYSGWENLRKCITDCLKTYEGVTNNAARLSELKSVSLRFVNHIEIPINDAELEDYFQVMPQIPSPIPQIFPSFLLNADIPYDTPLSVLRITFGTVFPKVNTNTAYVLDLNMYSLNNAVPLKNQITNWLERAHERIEIAFDASFKEKTHSEIFGEVRI